MSTPLEPPFFCHILDENKAVDIVSINLKGRSVMTDALIVASGSSTRHLKTLAEKTQKAFFEATGLHARIEGDPSTEWVLVDAGDCIIHLFSPQKRALYQLEKMWSPDFRPSPETGASDVSP